MGLIDDADLFIPEKMPVELFYPKVKAIVDAHIAAPAESTGRPE